MASTERNRYTTSLGVEGEFEPGSRGRVLKNLLGITSKREMDQIGYEALQRTTEHFANLVTQETGFTIDLIQSIHRCFLGGIYPWAGELRNVNVSKGGFTWPPAQFIESGLMTFEQERLRTLTPVSSQLSLEQVAVSLTEVHAELLFIHPFRDGNGRVARIVALLMALQAGYPPPHYGLEGRGSAKQKERYLTSVTQGYYRNYEPLTRFFEDALRCSLAELSKGD